MACRLILFQTSVRRTRKDPESLHKETGRIRKGPEGGRDRQEFRKDSGKSLKKKINDKNKNGGYYYGTCKKKIQPDLVAGHFQ